MNCSGDSGDYRQTVFANGTNPDRGDRSFRWNSCSGHGYLMNCLLRLASDDYFFPSWLWSKVCFYLICSDLVRIKLDVKLCSCSVEIKELTSLGEDN